MQPSPFISLEGKEIFTYFYPMFQRLTYLLLFFAPLGLFASHFCQSGHMAHAKTAVDSSYDVLFYHLQIQIDPDTQYIEGNTLCRFEAGSAAISQVVLQLTDQLSIDSIQGAASFTHNNDSIFITLPATLQPGQMGEVRIFYKGQAAVSNNVKGLRYETHGNNEPVVASLSTPFLAHNWYPCKDGPEDKADSVYIDISIPDRSYNGIPLTTSSNGLLEGIDSTSQAGWKTFQWRERYPIVTYYVMVAVSNYRKFSQNYTDPLGNTFPIEYYVFEEDLASSQAAAANFPAVMDFFTEKFGPYPFLEEKYAMTQLGFFSGIENQTNSIVVDISNGLFDLLVHELAHMWFADAITCADWGHGWLNEGFATYAEALWDEEANGSSAYQSNMDNTEYFAGGSIYNYNPVNPFGIFQGIIYNKGSWVLHMLRGVMGDADFFQAIKAYATDSRWAYGHATTEDFRDVCEQYHSTDLDTFFNQWVYDSNYPRYAYWWDQNASNQEVRVQIIQTQGNLNQRDVFEMPVQLRMTLASGGDTTFVVYNDSSNQSFTLNPGGAITNVRLDPDEWILRRTQTLVSLVDETFVKELKVWPNPGSGPFEIAFRSEVSLDFDLSIYDLQGRRIKKLSPKGVSSEREHRYDWDGNGENGQKLPKGMYLLRIKGRDFQKVIKILLSDE